ncbi:SdiA-regulated domain-containing protein [Rufibacter psychrotolerans]|uniref:SdiA-regulated domain-containing protein n=1 Tax=Rufibacter psychrotolerans TaxID=2812556 RepID=UPI0019686239|nr:SdiA-regulated domain-containing protein [Rufibacter sp. SYSU D00308]
MKPIQIMLSSLLFSFMVLGCDSNSAHGMADDKPKKSKKSKTVEAASAAVQVQQKWEVPEILREVSGIAYLGNGQFACVQDEAGVIFVYNTATQKIDRQVTFGAAGDYEGIALAGTTAYVVRSDGRLFEITNWQTEAFKVKDYETPLTEAHNVEGLAYDAQNQRLLLAIKGEETTGGDYKGVYAFDLAAKKLSAAPIFKLNLKDPQLSQARQKKASKVWQPSEIALHPVTGEIYLTEGANPQLFILNPDGSIKVRHKLSEATFYKPEGIAFSPSGDLFISNEGKKQPGNILQVRL